MRVGRPVRSGRGPTARHFAVCTSLLVIVATLNGSSGLAAAPNVPRHPYDPNHGAAAETAYGPAIPNLDGMSATPIIQSLKVPVNSSVCGFATYTVNSSCTVNGANLRVMQIGATAPQQAVLRNEFVGYGYGAGCGSIGCAGATTGGNYRERIYYDGVNSYGNYFGIWRDDVSVGNGVNLMMTRYGTYWTLHVNDVHKWSVITMAMTQGTGSVGSETTEGTPNMEQLYISWKHKQVGGSSVDVGSAIQHEPHPSQYYISSFSPSTGAYGSTLQIVDA